MFSSRLTVRGSDGEFRESLGSLALSIEVSGFLLVLSFSLFYGFGVSVCIVGPIGNILGS